MNRRDALKFLGATALVPVMYGAVPGGMRAFAQAAKPQGVTNRTLVLVELKGGNDGLNTLIPYADENLRRLRPSLVLPQEEMVTLGEGLAFNPALKPLMTAWDKGQLGILRGVGYPQPNRSHFRSIEIWETASKSEEMLREGWIASVLKGNVGAAADGIVIGDYEFGPLTGPRMRNVIMDKPDQFISQAQKIQAAKDSDGGGALGHLLRTRAELLDASTKLAPLFAEPPALPVDFPNNAFGNQLKIATQLIMAQAGVPVLKVSLGSFDTHVNQRGQHDNLLKQLGEGLAAFREAMIKTGHWNDVLVMTYSEFGRRANENASKGTDHGTAAPHLVMGGKAKGGFHGAQPRLDDLDAGDLKFSTDYRAVYATVARNWWGYRGEIGRLGAYKPLSLLA
ncbi:MAG TPA: DUF1501 domain-containing protein [Alphaproteobacteria bacterium]|nr:DUF1501 domain-containing protein [Alphaproteobacteria bacterium]